jgi:mRNA interferase RelE/StbE
VAVAFAAQEFIFGVLAQDPHRVGKPLREPLAPDWSARRGEYRVIYRIVEPDHCVVVRTVRHRRDAYRTS